MKVRGTSWKKSRAESSLSTAVSTSPQRDYESSSIPANPDIPLIDRGVTFFFSNYAIDGTRSVYVFLPTLYHREPAQSLLQTAVMAAGLAALYSSVKDSKILVAATRCYNSAMGSLREVLESAAAKTDQTLFSIILFCVYEVGRSECSSQTSELTRCYKITACAGSEAIGAWLKHTGGAAALIKLRGTQQFETETGCQLFLHLRIYIVCCRLQRVLRQAKYNWSP